MPRSRAHSNTTPTSPRGAKLTEVSVRPVLGGRNKRGILQHTQIRGKHGLKFTSSFGKVGFGCCNIKYSIYRSNNDESNKKHYNYGPEAFIHFHLHKVIKFGNKETKDVQFVGTAKKQNERKKLNRQYNTFVNRLQNLGIGIKFEALSVKLPQFECVVNKTSCLTLQPTKDCLISLNMPSTFVLALKEVDICYFERSKLKLRTFDLVFVLKDWDEDVIYLSLIPTKSKDNIMEWLKSCNITYYEGLYNLNWTNIMEDLLQYKNRKAFEDDGGWGWLEAEAESEDEIDDNEDESTSEDWVPGSDIELIEDSIEAKRKKHKKPEDTITIDLTGDDEGTPGLLNTNHSPKEVNEKQQKGGTKKSTKSKKNIEPAKKAQRKATSTTSKKRKIDKTKLEQGSTKSNTKKRKREEDKPRKRPTKKPRSQYHHFQDISNGRVKLGKRVKKTKDVLDL